VDDLRKIVDEHVRLREGALPEADRIIDDGMAEFRAWYASLEVVPVIRRMRSKAEALREVELDRLLRGLGHLSDEDRERVEDFSRRLQNKLLHEPTVRLRKGMAEGAGSELVDAVRFLYGLDDDPDRLTRPERPKHPDRGDELSADENDYQETGEQ
ncbi:MAG: hypothetical protein WD013_04455, partial [Gemmatimonadota bacterium]